MKVLYTSDLHLDSYFFKNNKLDKEKFSNKFFDEYELCILAGDLADFDNTLHHKYVQQFSELINHKPILFITGNHDYYTHEKMRMELYNSIFGENNITHINNFTYINNYFKSLEKKVKNFYFLNNSDFKFHDINFFGGTLWSKATPKSFIPNNDNNYINQHPYKDVRTMNRKENDIFLKKLNIFLDKNKGQKNVVISHFSPSLRLKNFNFTENKNNTPIEKYFSNNLDNILLSKKAPSYWFYGHNHYTDHKIFNHCHVLSHQSGYYHEDKINKITAEIIEIF